MPIIRPAHHPLPARGAHRRLTALAAIAVLASLTPLPAHAQHENDPMNAPAGWRWALDRPARLLNGGRFTSSDTLFEFVHMAPGWHVTMGPGGALFDPRERAEGRFVIAADLIPFPNASNAEYGVFVGGKALDGAGKEWYAFVLRVDGSAAVMHRAGDETHLVLPWFKHDAVKPRPDGASVTNQLAVRAEPDSIRFVVNGTRIAAFARAQLAVDGTFGFRIGEGINMHITNLDVTRRLAPYPVRR